MINKKVMAISIDDHLDNLGKLKKTDAVKLFDGGYEPKDIAQSFYIKQNGSLPDEKSTVFELEDWAKKWLAKYPSFLLFKSILIVKKDDNTRPCSLQIVAGYPWFSQQIFAFIFGDISNITWSDILYHDSKKERIEIFLKTMDQFRKFFLAVNQKVISENDKFSYSLEFGDSAEAPLLSKCKYTLHVIHKFFV